LRLTTPKIESAYQRVVYSKGGFVLHMLRQLMFDSKTGDADFMAMMQDFVKSHQHQNATTESFKAVVNRHMRPSLDLDGNGSMEWFFRQWVYGTEIPKYKFDYTVTENAGKWLVKARLTQSDVSPTFRMLVPIYVDLKGDPLLAGRLRMLGNSSSNEIQFTVPAKPKRVLINAFNDVLSTT
jgi:aminopeptidase N